MVSEDFDQPKAEWPQTVKEAAALILLKMDDKDKDALSSTHKEDLIKFHFGVGAAIRGNFGLWAGNEKLLEDTGTTDPDDASQVIIEAVWEELQTTRKPEEEPEKKIIPLVDDDNLHRSYSEEFSETHGNKGKYQTENKLKKSRTSPMITDEQRRDQMKRFVLVIIVIAVAAYFINNYVEDRARKKVKKTREEQIEKIAKATVKEMVSKTNAIVNWDESLSKEFDAKSGKILTIDLEKLWLGNRPILFIGYIDDVATYDTQDYILKIDQSLMSSIRFLGTSLSLELRCDKNKVDYFIEKHPDIISDIGLDNNIALVAKIDEIETTYYPSGEESNEDLKIGKGYCVDMVFIGDVDFETHNHALQ